MPTPCASVQQENLVPFQISFAGLSLFCGVSASMSDARDRIADALRRRLYPNSGVHLKQVAGAVGRSGEAVRQWAAGDAGIKAEDLYEVARFLGDPSLLRDVYGDLWKVERVGGVRRLWFTDHGATHDGFADHAEFVRRSLQLPRHAPGDLSAYARRNLGWVSVELRDGLAIAHYHDRGIDGRAASAAAAWLLGHLPLIDAARRRVDLNERLVEVDDRDGDTVAAALTRAAQIAKVTTRVAWRVERLPLDAAPALAPIIAAYHRAPERVVETVAGMGKLSACSLLRVSGPNVETVNVGSDVPCPHKGEFVGQNVFARADTAYAAVLHAHMQGATEGATLHWLRGSIFGRPVSYMRAALYAGPESGLVLSAPILRPSEEAFEDATFRR